MITENEWLEVESYIKERFDMEPELDAIIFLIGLQELGKGPIKLDKDQKMDVMHIGVCSLLEPYGYYKLDGLDEEGWPHFSRNKKLPFLSADEQKELMKESIVAYFRTSL